MQKQFIFNLGLIIILNLIIKPFYILGIDAEIQNQVGTAAYGTYFSLLNLTFLFNVVLDFGIVNFNTRNIAQHPILIKTHFNKLLSIRVVLFLFYIVIVLLTGAILGYQGDEIYYLSLLVINQFIIASIQFFRSNITALHWFKTEAVVSILDRFLLILFCSILLWSNLFDTKVTIEWFIYAQTISYGLTAIVCLFILRSNYNILKFNFKLPYALNIVKKSAPYALLIFLMFIYNRTDSIMIERILDDGNIHAGIYAQGFRYLDAISMFALLFASLLLPIYARLLKQNKSIVKMVEIPVRILIPGTILIAIICYFESETIMSWRYINYITESAETFAILILAFIPISFTYIFGTLLTANGSLKALNIMAGFGVVFNIGLNLFLIPEFEAYGAAVATLLTQSLTAIAQVLIAIFIFKFKINYKLLLSITFYFMFIILINMNQFQEMINVSYNGSTFSIFVKLIIGGIFLFAFRILKFSHFIAIFKQQN